MYQLLYDIISGDVVGISRLSDKASIPLAEGNTDFRRFLEWNAKQSVPLDLDSTIEVVPPPVKTAETFSLPVIAPDFIVQSPKPKKKHMEAHTEAIAEAGKVDKSIALIVLDLVVYVEELEKRLKKANI